MNQTTLPGRLGNKDATLEKDHRADPRIAAVLEMTGGLAPGLEPVKADATYEEALAYCNDMEQAAAAGHDILRSMMPQWP